MVRKGDECDLCVYAPTLQQSATFQTIDVRSNLKIKQYLNSVYTNRSWLVHGLESTEAVRAVSLSALAYAVTWLSPITIRDAPHR